MTKLILISLTIWSCCQNSSPNHWS